MVIYAELPLKYAPFEEWVILVSVPSFAFVHESLESEVMFQNEMREEVSVPFVSVVKQFVPACVNAGTRRNAIAMTAMVFSCVGEAFFSQNGAADKILFAVVVEFHGIRGNGFKDSGEFFFVFRLVVGGHRYDGFVLLDCLCGSF
jgi:hypothetical protein